jgi:hypothetical protein
MVIPEKQDILVMIENHGKRGGFAF